MPILSITVYIHYIRCCASWLDNHVLDPISSICFVPHSPTSRLGHLSRPGCCVRRPPTWTWASCTQTLPSEVPPEVPSSRPRQRADLTCRSERVTLLSGHPLMMPGACGRWLSPSARNVGSSGTCRHPAFSSSSPGLRLLAAENHSCVSTARLFPVGGWRLACGGLPFPLHRLLQPPHGPLSSPFTSPLENPTFQGALGARVLGALHHGCNFWLRREDL